MGGGQWDQREYRSYASTASTQPRAALYSRRSRDCATKSGQKVNVEDIGSGYYVVHLLWLLGLLDSKCYEIDLAGVFDCAITGETDCMVRCVKGDASGNGTTDMGDVANLKNANGNSWHSDDWPHYDVTTNGGLIEMGDLIQSKTWGEQVPFPAATCP